MIKSNIAKLNRRIVFQKLTEKIDEIGNVSTNYADYYSCAAEVGELYGEEYWAAQAVGQQNTVIFKVRYCSKIAELNSYDFRVIYGEKVFDIKQVDTMQGSKKFWKIKAVQNEQLQN